MCKTTEKDELSPAFRKVFSLNCKVQHVRVRSTSQVCLAVQKSLIFKCKRVEGQANYPLSFKLWGIGHEGCLGDKNHIFPLGKACRFGAKGEFCA